jgi:hypothetical protein
MLLSYYRHTLWVINVKSLNGTIFNFRKHASENLNAFKGSNIEHHSCTDVTYMLI